MAAQEKMDEELMRFQQKHGINTDQIKNLQKNKLDTQLAEFMAKAKQQKEATATEAVAAPAKEEEAPREVTEAS